MRTYKNMIEDYLHWLTKKTGDKSWLPANYLPEDVGEVELNLRKATVWKNILDLCYNDDDGIYWFWKFILGDMKYAGYPEKIHFNKLWWEWTKLMKKGDHISVKCPRQHGKSTYWTVIQPIYRTALFNSYNVLVESASEDQAMALLSYVVRVIENNEFLSSKKAKDAKWSTTEISFNGGKIVARGVGSEVRGGTYDYIICDDILRSDNKLSDDDIEHFVDEELEPMLLVRKGQLVIVGTPKSYTDIFSKIEERVAEGANWEYVVYESCNMETKEVLCPDRFTFDQLMRIRQNMGAIKFDKEFMCKTYASGSQVFPFDLRKRALEVGRAWKMYSRYKEEDLIRWRYYMGVDCARAGTASADYTVVFVVAFNADTQEKRIVWFWRKKGLKIQDQVQQIAEISSNFNHPVILVEKNNMGQDFIDLLVDTYNLNIESYTTGGRDQAKEELIRLLLIAFENEKLIMPSADEFSRGMMEELDKELDRFVLEVTKAGNEKMKGSGHSKDDMVISLALANRCSQSLGYAPMATSTLKSRNTTSLERFVISGDQREYMRI